MSQLVRLRGKDTAQTAHCALLYIFFFTNLATPYYLVDLRAFNGNHSVALLLQQGFGFNDRSLATRGRLKKTITVKIPLERKPKIGPCHK